LLRAAEIFADVEVGLALVASCYAAFAASGGPTSPLHPLIYGVVAFSATAMRGAAAIAVAAAAIGLEIALAAGHGQPAIGLAAHIAFIAGAGLSHLVLLRGLVARARRHFRHRTTAAITRQAEAARDYRLFGAALSQPSRPRPDAETLLAAGSVETIRSGARFVLQLVRTTLGARTAALLWLDARGDHLVIEELETDSPAFTDARRVAVSGVLGAVVRDVEPVVLAQARRWQVPYYEEAIEVGAFAGVPIVEGNCVRGVLAVDRDEPFAPSEIAILEAAADQLMRQVQGEVIFAALERSKYEHERFFHASAKLGEALTFEQVIETAFDAAAEIVDHELAVIALYDRDRRRHKVVGTRIADETNPMISPAGLAELANLEYRDNQGLVSMVVKNRHFLPAACQVRDVTAPVFTRKIKLKKTESLVVLPLLSGDEPVGTFTLASRGSGVFRSDIREMLSVIANQVAVSIENALMYKKMQTMATTDGLTGLTNHRTFQERFDELLGRSRRHSHQAAVLLCDVDHFKGVNDTYGHPVGDEVLRRVAQVLRSAVRKIDIPARYGGEEFAVVLEATDRDGAVGLAERIRTDVGALSFPTDKGTFQITMSIGVATFPHDSEDKAILIERADTALYHAKETGRNRVVSYAEAAAARRKQAG
jgi:diguanylate cyclase (GGDEF)-like protein